MTLPTNSGPFRVAELVTCQKTLQAVAPLVRFTVLLVAVISDDDAVKM